jgi:hypothetical protein
MVKKVENGFELEVVSTLGAKSPKPNKQRLDAFEKSKSIKLPLEYRNFVSSLGAGELNGYVRIHAPNSPSLDLVQLNEICTSTKRSRASYLAFADTVGGDLFLWKSSIQREGYSEYPVYFLPKDSSKIVKFAPTFQKFIELVCDGCRLGISAGRRYQPFGKKPSKSQIDELIRERMMTLYNTAGKQNTKKDK